MHVSIEKQKKKNIIIEIKIVLTYFLREVTKIYMNDFLYFFIENVSF